MTPKKIRVADYIAQRLVEAGAKHAFLVTGGGAMHLNDALHRNKNLKIVCFHHEQAAAMAAESYYRLSNRLAVLNVTTGPGGINALNGVYGAYVDSLAMLVISGQVKRETYLRNYSIPLRQLGDQEVDITSMVQPIVKYATVLQDPEQVRSVMDKAILIAQSGRPGPVWIDVPIDIQAALIDERQLEPFSGNLQELIKDENVTPNTKLELTSILNSNNLNIDWEFLINRLKHAERPVMFVGSGVRISGMHKEFLALVEKLSIPVVTGWNAHDTLTNDNECYVGRPGTVGDRAGNFAVQNADFLLILGSRLNIRQISYNWKSFAPKAYKVMVDVDQAELDKPTLAIDYKVCMNLKKFIPDFFKAIETYKIQDAHLNYLSWCRERVDRYPTVLSEYAAKSEPVNPYIFMDVFFKTIRDDDIVVAGNGSACVMSFQAALLRFGQRLYTNSGSASMGYDLPAAIGACLASGQRVMCLAGDGSLMMNLQELQTLVGYKLPVKIIVINNCGYHSIRQTQQAYFPDNMFGIGPDNGVSLPDFVKLARAFKIDAVSVNKLDDWYLDSTQKLLASQTPALIEVFVDPNQTFSPKLASRKLDDGTMISPSLEDMAPFLSREELNENLIKDR